MIRGMNDINGRGNGGGGGPGGNSGGGCSEACARMWSKVGLFTRY
jgi:hypothetical protein